MFQLSFTIEGEQQLSRILELASQKVKDWSPAFAETAQTMKFVFSTEVFATEGAVIGERWSPLSRAYAFEKSKRYPGQGLLQATGKMKNSFQTSYNGMSATISNSAPYFPYHQSNQPRRKLPRRVMMKLGNSQKEQIVKIFQKHFQSVIRPS